MVMGAGGGTLGSAEFVLLANADQLIGSLDALRGVVEQQTQMMAQQLSQQERAFVQTHQRVGESAKEASTNIGQVTQSLSEIVRVAAGFTVATTVVGVFTQIADAVRETVAATVELGQETAKVQAILGGTAQEASATLAVFERYGVGMQQTTRTMTSLAQAMDVFLTGGATGTQKTAGSQALQDLQEFGLRLRDVDGNARALKDVLPDVIDALSKVEDPVRRDNDASALFGYRWQQLSLLIASGKEGWDSARQSAIDMGATMDNLSEQKMQKLYAAQHELGEATKGLSVTLGVTLADSLTVATNKTTDLLTQTNALIKAMQQGIPAPTGLPIGGERSIGVDAQGKPVLGPAPSGGFTVNREAYAAAGLPPPGAPPDTSAADRVEKEKQALKDYAQFYEDNLKDQRQKTQQWYDDQVTLAKNAYDAELQAAQESHQAVVADLNNQIQAENDAYDRDVQNLRNAEQDKLDAAKATHEANLQAIQQEREQAQQNYNLGRGQLTQERDLAVSGLEWGRDYQLGQLRDQQQATHEQWQRDDAAQRLAQEQEDYRNRTTHEQSLQRLQDNMRAFQEYHDSQVELAQDTERQSIRTIENETQAYDNQHRARLQAIDQEQRAAQDEHTANLRAIDEEKQQAQDQHDARMQNLRDQEEQARRTADAAIAGIRDQEQADQDQHDAKVRQIQDELAAQKAAWDEQKAALQEQLAVQRQADQDRAQQEALQRATERLTTDITAGAGGDPTRILADQQAVADAQAQIATTARQRELQDQIDAIDQQASAAEELARQQKQLLDDQLAEQRRVAEAAIRLTQDTLQSQLDALKLQEDAENDAWRIRQRQIQDEIQAENDRYQRRQRQIQDEVTAENNAAQAFHQAQQRKQQDAEDTLRDRTKQLNDELDGQKTTYQQETRAENARYAKEQEDIKETRAIAAEKQREERQQTDDHYKHETEAVQAHYQASIDWVKNLYDNPTTGLFAQLQRSYNDTLTTLQQRTELENAHYANTQKQIKDTYESTEPNAQGVMGLIPELEKAHTETERTLKARLDYENDHYWPQVQANIKDKYYNNDDPDHPTGIITALERAKTKTDQLIVDELENWTTWSKEVTANAAAVTAAFKRLEDQINAANNARDRRPAAPTGGGTAPAEGGGGYAGYGGDWAVSFGWGQTYTGDYRTGTPHRGIDLFPTGRPGYAGMGTPIGAFESGRVTFIGMDPGGAGGLMVYVLDADGLTHAYMHLGAARVHVGETIRPGDVIGLMGESGTEGAPHLHYEVRRNAPTGDPGAGIDPRPWVFGYAGLSTPPPSQRDMRAYDQPPVYGPSSQEQVTHWLELAIEATGVPSDWLSGLLHITGAESGTHQPGDQSVGTGDPNARNPSGAAGLMQCVPLDTEILTRKGWRHHDQIAVGDETLGFNPETGRNEWTRINEIVRYDDGLVWHIGNKLWSARVTPHHRWWSERVDHRTPERETTCPDCHTQWPSARGMHTHLGRAHGKRLPRQRQIRGEFVETYKFKKRDRLRLAAPADTGEDLALSLNETRILAWILGDGHVSPPTRSRRGLQVAIYQSKPAMVTKLKALLAEVPHKEYVRQRGSPRLPAHEFRLPAAYARDLLDRSEVARRGLDGLVLAFTPAQRAAFLDAMIDAEGHRQRVGRQKKDFVRIAQREGSLADAITLAVYLEGYRPSRTALARYSEQHSPAVLIGMCAPHVVPEMFGPPETLDRQPVWCVMTGLSSWTMRQNGQVMLTGNTKPGTFQSYLPTGMDPDIYDPVSNAAAAIEYIRAAYGTPYKTPYYRSGQFSIEGVAGYAMGGLITVPSLLTDLGTGLPYGVAGEAGWEKLTPVGAGAAATGAPAPSFHFDVRGPSMHEVAYQIRREFERTSWLHQGWR